MCDRCILAWQWMDLWRKELWFFTAPVISYLVSAFGSAVSTYFIVSIIFSAVIPSASNFWIRLMTSLPVIQPPAFTNNLYGLLRLHHNRLCKQCKAFFRKKISPGCCKDCFQIHIPFFRDLYTSDCSSVAPSAPISVFLKAPISPPSPPNIPLFLPFPPASDTFVSNCATFCRSNVIDFSRIWG